MDLHDHERVAVALQNLRDADEELNNLIAAEAGLRAAATELLARAGELSRRIREAEPGVDQWKELKRLNASFNEMYLALQERMQNESRRFTLLSNVLKTKHDTAKNSISNLR